MSTATRIVLGILVGVALSLVTLVAALAGVRLLAGLTTISRPAAVITLLCGAILGAVGVGLGYLTAGKERSLLVLLIGLALAALAVMVGGYGNGSLLPLGIYVLAAVNSLMIARVTAVLVRHAHGPNEPNLGG